MDLNVVERIGLETGPRRIIAIGMKVGAKAMQARITASVVLAEQTTSEVVTCDQN